jgi:hypothetical protein
MTYQVSHAQGELLAQVRPGVTTPITLFAADELRVEITLVLAVVTAGTVAIDFFHDDDGTTYDNTTIIGAISKAKAGEPIGAFQAQHPGSGIMIKPGGSLGVQIDSADDATISVYGVTETLAERVRGLVG